jgi:hypothetical protein
MSPCDIIGWGIDFNSDDSPVDILDDGERVHYFETYYTELAKAVRYVRKC